MSLGFRCVQDAEELTREDKGEILARAFQVIMSGLRRAGRASWNCMNGRRPAGGAQALVTFTPRDWRDLQLLSQLAWMEESWLEKDDVVGKLSRKEKISRRRTKSPSRKKQFELLRMVLPAYRDAAQRGQIEISTTPFYHPILPLICDSDIARVANPGTPLPRRAFSPSGRRARNSCSARARITKGCLA